MTFPSKALISEADYSAIEDALHATEKGRRFLRAYVDRNRSLESRRLLRSISRLHHAALGAPGLQAEVSRDLMSVLKSVARHRQRASDCADANAKSRILAGSIQEVEATLIALIESAEERKFGTLADDYAAPSLEPEDGDRISAHSARLYGELSSYFSGEPL
jgi:hypothetical protein